MNAPAILELPLDDALLKVLSSESRREILRLLRERRMTGAELATRLELGKPAVAEHLKKLQEALLIERFDDPERRWVYYNLSARGRGILEPQRVRFYLVMAVAALGLMVGVALALGLVVLMQGAHPGSGVLSGPDNGLGSDALGGQGSPGLGTGAAIGAVPNPNLSVIVATTSSSPAAPAASSAGGPVYAGDHMAPKPVGNATPVRPSSQANALLIDPRAAPPIHHNAQGVAEVTVLVYRAQDIDAANNTVRFHLVPLNASALAAANLTEAVKTAAIVPDVGLVLQVPDGTVLPEAANDTATIALQPVPSDATGHAGLVLVPAANATTSTASNGSAPAHQPVAATAPAPAQVTTTATSFAPVQPAGPAATQAAATVAPQPGATTHTASAGTGASDSAAAQNAAGGQPGSALPLGQDPGTRTAVSASKAAPIPLVALLAAALMVSVYLPNRRK